MTEVASNDIPVRQNEQRAQDLLQASNVVYAKAKLLHRLQIYLTVGVPMIGSLCTLAWPNLRGVVAFLSLSIAILDPTAFDRIQRQVRRSAAKVQEEFDCSVLTLHWDKFSVGARLEPEEIRAYVARHPAGADQARLKDWYPKIVGQVPLHIGRIICQRTNLWYDSKLRREYSNWVLGVTVALCLVLIALSILTNSTVEGFIVGVLAPATPIIIFGLREFFRQRDAADLLDKLRTEAQGLWERALKGDCSDEECTALSRQFQNALFEHRRTSPLIFEWVYRRMRSNLEDQMTHGAEEYVGEYRAASR